TLAEQRISLVCCGFRGQPDLDDCLAAGLIGGLIEEFSGGTVQATGATNFARGMLRSYTDPLVALWHSTAGVYLRELGSEEDLALAAATSVSTAVPELIGSDAEGVAPLFRFQAAGRS